MATARSRITKGRLYQKKVMQRFKDVFELDEDDIRTAVGAETGEDIKLSKRAREKVGLSIECKNMKSMNIWSAIDQAQKNCPKGCEEAVVFKRGTLGAHRSFICVSLDHYLELRRQIEALMPE
jgi:hypothetical protein